MIEKYLIVGLFAALLIGLSYFSARRTRQYSDYNLAGRRLGLPRLIGTLGAAEFNTATLIGGASVAYLLWGRRPVVHLVDLHRGVQRLRLHRGQALQTAGDLDDPSSSNAASSDATQNPRAVASFVTLTFTWIAPSTYLAGLAVITSVLLGVDPVVTIVVITVFCLVLAMAGGFMTAVSFDVVAYTMILILIPVLFVVGYVNAGGFTALSDVYEPRYLSFEPIWDLEDYGFAAILTWCFQNIMLYIAAPWYGQRVFSARTEKIAYRGMLANTVLITALYSLVAVTTMFSRVLMPDLEQPEEALPQLINDYLPAVMQGLMLVMLLLVGISTMVAIWNSAVSIVVNDFIKRYFARTKRQLLHLASRAVFIVLGISAWPLPSLSSATFFWPLPMSRSTPLSWPSRFWRVCSGSALPPRPHSAHSR